MLYAAEMAGTDFDLDSELEVAAVEHLLKAVKPSVLKSVKRSK